MSFHLRSLDTDTKVKLLQAGPDDAIEFIYEYDDSAGTNVGTQEVLAVEARVGVRHLLEVYSVPEWGGEIELSAVQGRQDPLAADKEEQREAQLRDCREAAARARASGNPAQEILATSTHLGHLRRWNRNDEEAGALMDRASALSESRLGPRQREVGVLLHEVGTWDTRFGDDREACLPSLERSLRILDESWGPGRHGLQRDVLSSLGNCLRTLGRPQEGPERTLAYWSAVESHARETANMRLQVAAARQIGFALTGVQKREEAGRSFERAVEIARESFGPASIELAWALGDLAYHHMFDSMVLAADLYSEACAINEATLSPMDPRLRLCLNLEACTLRHLGRYEEARAQFARIIQQLRQQGLLRQLPSYLNALAEVHYFMAEYAQQKALLTKASRIGGDENPGGFALVARAMGDLEEARRLNERALERALERARSTQRPGDWLLVRTLHGNLAGTLADMGEFDLALEHLDRAEELFDRVRPEHRFESDRLTFAAKRGRLLGRMGRTPEAIDLIRPVIDYLKKSHGERNPYLVGQYITLARLYAETGDMRAAMHHAREALSIAEEKLGPDHPSVAEALALLAWLEASAGEIDEAVEHALRAERVGRDHARLLSGTLHQELALGYASSRVTGLDLALSLGTAEPSPERSRQLWDAMVRSRALVLDAMAARNRAVYETEDPEVAALARDFRRKSTQLANLLVRGLPEGEGLAVHLAMVDEIRRQAREAEEALAAKSVLFRDERRVREAELTEVLEGLPSDAALVAYVKYEELEPGRFGQKNVGKPDESKPTDARAETRHRYAAFVRTPGRSGTALVPLGNAGVVEDSVTAWRDVVLPATDGSDAGPAARDAVAVRRSALAPAGRDLRRTVWDPVAKHLSDARRVFVVPDGALNLVNFAALPLDEGGYLVEHGPIIHYLSAERDLVRREEPGETTRTLLALGGADFDATRLFAALTPGGDSPAVETASTQIAGKPGDNAAGAEYSSTPQPVAQVAALRAFRGERSSCSSLAGQRFDYLEHTGAEIDEIAVLWKKEAVRVLTGAAATESAFKTQAPGQEHLHLATHGFFLGGECKAALAGSRGLHPGGRGFGGVAAEHHTAMPAPGGDTAPPPRAEGENPLILSGLVLAGANNREHAGPDEDDGILTAQEIAAMDLSSVEWAVLSACDTGVGEIRAGEGVFGLRRAFQVAGADTLIMSLWSVEDESARRWMKALYEGRLTKGMDTAEAVRHASLTVLNDRRDRGLSDHPFFWAGFVAAGDWR